MIVMGPHRRREKYEQAPLSNIFDLKPAKQLAKL
jgi:hypothetical protein